MNAAGTAEVIKFAQTRFATGASNTHHRPAPGIYR